MRSAPVFARAIGAVLLLAGWALWSAPVAAQTYLPEVKIGTAALVDPSSVETWQSDSPSYSHSDNMTVTTPPEIVALARALKNDPDQIYQYVRNNIEVVWEYGLQKGALGASIDRAGTPFDQAMLMVELLRQAGYTANYQTGTITLNGTQFAAWTNITSAAAACQLLSSGGIPAKVNGTTGVTNCSSTFGSATVSTVEMAHVWVKVAIAGDPTCGSSCLFDPSYKTYNWLAGYDFTGSAMSFTSGAPMTQATGGSSGMTSGTISSLPYVQSLNQGNLNTLLTTYATNLLTYLRTNNYSSVQMEDVVGGGVIQPASTGALRQTTLPYAGFAMAHNWSGTIPDRYRTTLTVSGAMRNPSTLAIDTLFNNKFYVDEIYGRRLEIGTNFNQASGFDAYNYYITTIKLDGQPIAATSHTMGGVPNGHDPVALTISADHPYASAANGTTTLNHDYMDVTIYKSAILANPVTIVDGFGDAGPELLAKWSGEGTEDTADPIRLNPPSCPTECPDPSPYLSSSGDFTRDKVEAGYLAQFTRAVRLHAALAGGYASGARGGIAQIHHVLGVIYGDDYIDDDGWVKGPYQQPDYWVADSYMRIDVDTGLSFTSKTANATARRGALLAMAATGAALEGSIVAQMSDVPDTSSTATRFEWGNAPPSGEDPIAGGAARRFFQVPAYTSVPSSGWVTWENSTATPSGGTITDGQPQAWGSTVMSTLRTNINAYTAAGYIVTTSQESFLGPGQRGGFVKMNGTAGSPAPSKQRGGALVATKYDGNGDPTDIAHDVVGMISSDSYGVVRMTKGGGGGVQPNIATTYSPSDPADILKTRFVDRSNALGVNLANGSLAYSSPATISLGTGGTPFELSASYVWRPGPPPSDFGPVPQGPSTGWVSSWQNSLTVSGSGMEGMGASDVRAAAGTIAAFLAAQDIYANNSPGGSRDVAGVLTQSWLVKQYVGNTVTTSLGGGTEQFVRLADGNWIKPGTGYAQLVQTGTRAPFEMRCGKGHYGPTYALSRGWDSSSLSFVVTDALGNRQNYGYWLWHGTGANNPQGFCDRTTGFRLNSMTFANGVVVSIAYANDTTAADGASRSTSPNATTAYPSGTIVGSVSNSLGRTLTFGTNVTTGQPTVTDGSRTLTGPQALGTSTTDPAGNVTTFAYTSFGTSSTQRPVPYSLLYRVYTADNASLPNVQYDYDGVGRIYQVHDANNLQIGDAGTAGGRAPYQFYVADGWRGERVDPAGYGYRVYYDTYRHPMRYIDENGHETLTSADGRGRVTSYTYPEGDRELFTYDYRNNTLTLTKKTKPSDAGLADMVMQVAYGEGTTVAYCSNVFTCNRPITQTNARGYVSNFAWDSATGLLTQVRMPAPVTAGNRPEKDYTYSSFGGAGFKLLTSTMQVTGPSTGSTGTHTTTFTYNSSNYYVPASASVDSTGLNLTTIYTFDGTGNPTAVDGPRSDVTDVTNFTWDANRRQVYGIQADPDGAGVHPRPAFKNTYDAVGRVTVFDTGTATSGTGGSWTSSTNTVTTVYDPVGNKIKESTGTRVMQFSYTAVNRVRCVAVRMNFNSGTGTFGTMPADICALSTPTTFGQDRITRFAYDGVGQVLTEEHGVNSAVQITYVTNTYTPNDKLASVYDANGSSHTTTYVYDGFDRLKTTSFADSSTEQLTYYASGALCSATGQPCTRTNRSGQVFTMTYDPLDRLATKAVPAGDSPALAHTVTMTYDLVNQVTNINDTFSDSTSNIIINSFDTAGRLSYTTRITPVLAGRTVTYQYDAAGNRTRLQWPDGYYVLYNYDALNHPTTVTDPDGTTLATYLYDDLARRASLQYNGTTGAKLLYSWSAENDLLTLQSDFSGTTNDVSFTNTFSPAHQWTTATVSNAAFRYGPSTTATATFAAGSTNQLTTINGGTVYTDSRGNYTGSIAGYLVYDAENRLVKASTNIAYAYDPMGRRTSKTVAGTTTNFLHDGDMEIAEYDGSGNLLRRFIPGPTIDDHIAMVTPSGTKTFFHTDKMGSVIAMSDMSGAITEGPFVHDPYGVCTVSGAPCFSGEPYHFTGQRLDAESNFYYYRARYYLAVLGRFLQTDPIGYKDNINLYAYVQGDPTDLTDPMGLYDITLKFLKDKDITVSIDDNLPAEQRQMADDQVRGAADLTLKMDKAGLMGADQRAALHALNSISISNDRAGLNNESGNFNYNVGEMQTTHDNQATTPGGEAAVAASMAIHDGWHGVQHAQGRGVVDKFPGDPTKAGHPDAQKVADYKATIVQTEREAIGVQNGFINAVPNLPGSSLSPDSAKFVTNFFQNQTDAKILERFTRP